MGFLLCKKMGSAADRCLFSNANLVAAVLMNFFGRPQFKLTKHREANEAAVESIHVDLKLFEATKKKLTHAELERMQTKARKVHGNTSDVPAFCRQEQAFDEHGVEITASISHLVSATLIVPPVFHVQNHWNLMTLAFMLELALAGEAEAAELRHHLSGIALNAGTIFSCAGTVSDPNYDSSAISSCI